MIDYTRPHLKGRITHPAVWEPCVFCLMKTHKRFQTALAGRELPLHAVWLVKAYDEYLAGKKNEKLERALLMIVGGGKRG